MFYRLLNSKAFQKIKPAIPHASSLPFNFHSFVLILSNFSLSFLLFSSFFSAYSPFVSIFFYSSLLSPLLTFYFLFFLSLLLFLFSFSFTLPFIPPPLLFSFAFSLFYSYSSITILQIINQVRTKGGNCIASSIF